MKFNSKYNYWLFIFFMISYGIAFLELEVMAYSLIVVMYCRIELRKLQRKLDKKE